jgi:hypothetical protein
MVKKSLDRTWSRYNITFSLLTALHDLNRYLQSLIHRTTSVFTALQYDGGGTSDSQPASH